MQNVGLLHFSLRANGNYGALKDTLCPRGLHYASWGIPWTVGRGILRRASRNRVQISQSEMNHVFILSQFSGHLWLTAIHITWASLYNKKNFDKLLGIDNFLDEGQLEDSLIAHTRMWFTPYRYRGNKPVQYTAANTIVVYCIVHFVETQSFKATLFHHICFVVDTMRGVQ